jgi:hypothetical protein
MATSICPAVYAPIPCVALCHDHPERDKRLAFQPILEGVMITHAIVTYQLFDGVMRKFFLSNGNKSDF